MTDLRDSEIVLGKILGSLLPIWLLLATTVPLLMFLLLLGGVSVQQVIQAVLVAAATSLAAASLGGLVALWRDRTFQSLALTVLLVVFYLCLVRGLALLLELIPALAHQPVLAWLDPFEASATFTIPWRLASLQLTFSSASWSCSAHCSTPGASSSCASGTPAANPLCSVRSPTKKPKRRNAPTSRPWRR